ncbi:MAG: DUF3667 domain-containing protein [Gemmatimonadaceae bacterium]
MRHIAHEVTDVDSKYISSFRALIFAPGKLTEEFFAGRRDRYLSPLKLFLIVGALSLVLAWDTVLDWNGAAQKITTGTSYPVILRHVRDGPLFVRELLHRTGEYMSWLRFGSVFGLAAALKLIYRKRALPYMQHVIFAFHYYAMDFFLFTLLGVAVSLTHRITGSYPPQALARVHFLLLLVYVFIALRRLYPESKTRLALRSALVLIADTLVYSLAQGLSALVAMLVLLIQMWK